MVSICRGVIYIILRSYLNFYCMYRHCVPPLSRLQIRRPKSAKAKCFQIENGLRTIVVCELYRILIFVFLKPKPGQLSRPTEAHHSYIFNQPLGLVTNPKNDELIHLYFEERNTPPQEKTSRILIAHGFHKELTIQGFPLRGNTVYLPRKTSRWLEKATGEVVHRD